MTPSVPTSRPAAPRGTRAGRAGRRSAADLAAAAAAILALAALTVGVPVALVFAVGLPVPHTMPTLSDLTRQLDVLAVLRVLSVIVWLAWLQLVVCVVAEVRAAVRNSGMPPRVPLAGGTQPLVHRLVTTALLLASAATALSPALVQQAPARPAHAISASQPGAGARPHPGEAGQAGQAGGQPGARQRHGGQHATGPTVRLEHGQAARAEKFYEVKPPVGRYHESLWEIAQNHLGNGRRYREIFELNAGRVQPDGSKLTIASLIRPGWVLRMPADAYGPGIEVITHGADARTPALPAAAPERAARAGRPDASAGPQAHSGETGSRARHPGEGAVVPGTGAAPGTPATAVPPGRAGSAAPVFPSELAAASLLAAGLLAALGRRRREQLWARAFGQRVVAPGPETAGAEAALRLGASEPSAHLLDVGLRSLSQALGQQGRTPPTVFAAHMSEAELDLWVAPADLDAPPPWVAIGDGQVWRLPSAAVPALDPASSGAALAPYPGLVSIGTDDTGRVLVDLESAHGLIAVTGPADMVQAMLAAMAAELATNRWSDRMDITLVGFGADLAVLAPSRITIVPTLAEALPVLEERTAEVEAALAAAGVGSVLTGRSRGVSPEAWAPHYLISAVTPSPAERSRLIALARTRHATATGYVVAGDVAGATWTWELTGQGRLRAGLLGLDVQAQLLPAHQQRSVVDLFQAAAERGGTALAVPVPDDVPLEHLDPAAIMPVEVTMLGQVSVRAPGVIEPDRLAVATEVVVYLAAHPAGVHLNVLSAAVWPRGAGTGVRDATLARVREWLGTDGIGRPHLATEASGRLRLGPGVRVDWGVFRTLVAYAAPGRSGKAEGAGPAAAAEPGEAGYLARALSLVGGPFLGGRDRRRYAWLAAEGLDGEVTARVADAAHRLWELRLAAGDPFGAMDAARAGLRLADADELLWRDLLCAAHASGRPALLRRLVEEVCARTSPEGEMGLMSPETEALIDELLPSWRTSVA